MKAWGWRESKDGKVNKEGRRLREAMEDRGWGVLNGCRRGVEAGEYTFTGAGGNRVIDYAMTSEEEREEVEMFEVDDRVESDHQLVVVWVNGGGGGGKGGEGIKGRRCEGGEGSGERREEKVSREGWESWEGGRREYGKSGGRYQGG